MQRVTRATAVPVLPPIPASPGTPGYFAKPDPLASVPATIPGYEWHNGVQEEIVAAILDTGIVLDAETLTQLRQSIRRIAGGNATSISASQALTPDHAGLVVVTAAGGAVTLTLPAASAAGGRPFRYDLVRTDSTAANALTIQRAGADTIEGTTSITVPIAGRMSLVSDGVSAWRVISSSAFGVALAIPGLVRLPGGVIMQWGTATHPATGQNSSSIAIVFPVAFPTAVGTIVAIAAGAAHSVNLGLPNVGVTALTTSGATLSTDTLGWTVTNQSVLSRWLAIGW